MRKRWAAALLLAAAVLAAAGWGLTGMKNRSAAGYPVRGVDVSHYQGEVDFNQLAEQGMQFAYIKATEGSSHIDECLAQNLQKVRNAPIRAGFYHFFSYDSPGIDQAMHFIACVPAQEGMLPPAIDVEFYADKAAHPAAREQVIPELRVMVDALEQAYGVKPVIYCTLRAYRLYIRDAFEDCDLWIRSVYFTPRLDRNWTFWQVSDWERLEGYSGEEECIDVNVFHGTEEAFSGYPETIVRSK